MKKSLIDTDILSYFLRRHPKVVANFEKHIDEHGCVYISRVTVVEILGGLKAKNAEKQIERFKALLEQHEVLELTPLAAEISSDIFAELQKKGKHSGNFDVLIASIAMANNLTLVTNNTKDFENIDGLELANWTLKVY